MVAGVRSGVNGKAFADLTERKEPGGPYGAVFDPGEMMQTPVFKACSTRCWRRIRYRGRNG